MLEPKSYKDTVNLPQTKFDMRANAVKREPELQQFWEEQQIYQNLSDHNPGDVFVLHDGPPYANGDLHIGHALNKILKDIINRYQLLQGRKVRYVPGWDCHGLPIELKVLQNMKDNERKNLTPLALRKKAREFAIATMEKQRAGFKRYGVWGHWDEPYMTLTPEYEVAQIEVFGQMFLKGYIYRGLKPVHWSPSSQTALAEAELEYPENHFSQSIYVTFPITKLGDQARYLLQPYLPDLAVAIWTTTPWTIPGNLAVAVNPDLMYAVVESAQGFPQIQSKYIIVAAAAVERLSVTLETQLNILDKLRGKDLENCLYHHPLFDRISPVVIGGDYITTDSGTGLVHTAPGHGQEDFIVGQRYGLPIFAPVDDHGNFTAEAGPFVGKNVLGDGNTAVIEALAQAQVLLKQEKYNHKYPYDWRTKKPTIFRATEQWFASVEGFRDHALQAITQVKWFPAQGENRITAMVADRSDWCISRQRSWGLPIPVFYDEATNEPLLNAETIEYVKNIFAAQGSDAWWELSVEELLPEKYRDNGRKYRKGMDTMDVWFDSGSSWAAVGKQRGNLKYPVDLYLEGSDQHRGWFQSSLLTSVAVNGFAPYQAVLTHGFTVDEKGLKMSKSIGNVVDPQLIIEGGKNKDSDPPYGADILRLWASSVDYSTDVPLGKTILKQLADVYRKIRNTARFLLGNLHDFDPVKDAVAYEDLPELDRYMLHRITEVFSEIKDAFDTYEFFRFFQVVQNFCVNDLSSFYLDIAKDRLYISAVDATRRRSCQTVMTIALENLAKAIAPVLCHLAEDIWQNLPYAHAHQSVFQAGWVKLEEKWHDPELGKKWEKLKEIRSEVNKVLERARMEKAIGSSLEAKVILYVKDQELAQQLQELNPSLAVPSHAEIPFKPVEIVQTGLPKIDISAKDLRKMSQKTLNVSQDTLAATVNYLANFPENVTTFWDEYQQIITAFGLVFALIIVAKVAVAILGAIDSIPVLGSLLELVGLFATVKFGWRYLLFANGRADLGQQIKSVQGEVLAKSKSSKKRTSARSKFAHYSGKSMNDNDQKVSSSEVGNGVDELRYLFITSGVELVMSPASLQDLQYQAEADGLMIGVAKADGEKCDRCWNYSTTVGDATEDPLICDRCVAALAGEF